MRNTLKSMGVAAKRLHNDEQGAEGLEKLLIVAAIVLPLLGVLIIFRNAIKDFIATRWDDMVGKEQITDPTPATPS